MRQSEAVRWVSPFLKEKTTSLLWPGLPALFIAPYPTRIRAGSPRPAEASGLGMLFPLSGMLFPAQLRVSHAHLHQVFAQCLLVSKTFLDLSLCNYKHLFQPSLLFSFCFIFYEKKFVTFWHTIQLHIYFVPNLSFFHKNISFVEQESLNSLIISTTSRIVPATL